jgi:hypothetical protein
MIHLIGKLYLTTDQVISKDNNRVVISDAFGYPELGRNDENHFDLYAGTLIAFAQGQTLPEEYTSWGDMISHLIKVSKAEDKRVYINADTLSATEILTAWFKMLLPEATAGVLHNLMLAYKFKFDLLEGPDVNPLVVEDSGEYGSIFTATDAMDIDVDYNDVSIEFLLASYVNDGSYQNELVDKLCLLLNRYAEDIVEETREGHYISLSLGDTPDEFMTGSRLWPNGPRLKSTAININNITTSDINKISDYLNTRDKSYLSDMNSSELFHGDDVTILKHAVQWSTASKITKGMLNSLIDIEKHATSDVSIFTSGRLRETCNSYLAKDILNDNTPNMFYE